MSDELLNLESAIHELLASRKSVGDSMQSLIEAHQKEYPHGDWAPFKSM